MSADGHTQNTIETTNQTKTVIHPDEQAEIHLDMTKNPARTALRRCLHFHCHLCHLLTEHADYQIQNGEG